MLADQLGGEAAIPVAWDFYRFAKFAFELAAGSLNFIFYLAGGIKTALGA